MVGMTFQFMPLVCIFLFKQIQSIVFYTKNQISGPWSHLFAGAYEQNTLPHLMSYAACLGNQLTACNNLFFYN